MVQTAMRLAGENDKPMPRKIGFTVANLTAAKCPAGKERLSLYDARTPGLALRITPSGSKTFIRYGKVNGLPQRVRLGGFPDISIEQARKLAATTTGQISSGVDPMAEKRATRMRVQTLGELWTWYLENHAKPRKRSWKTDEYRWKKYLESKWGSRRLSDITRGDVQALMTQIGKEHSTGANRVLALLSVMFSKAKLNGYAGDDPTEGIERFKEKSRERFLGSDELPPLPDSIGR